MGAAARINSPDLDGSIDRSENEPDDQLGLIEVMCDAAKVCHLQEKELAIKLGYDPGYFSLIKSGKKELQASRIGRLPRKFRRVLWTLAARRDGLVVAPENARKDAMGNLLVALGQFARVCSDDDPALAVNPRLLETH